MLTAGELEAEARLIQTSQRDPRRFAELYDRYLPRIYAFALTRSGDRASAEDVTAETFRRAFQELPRFEWRGVPFSAWLFRIAANAASDAFRSAARQTTLDALPEEGNAWEPLLAEADRRLDLLELVNRLTPDQRRVIVMRFAQEKTGREIARALGRSEAAVKQLQFRALHNLRRMIEEEP